MANGKEINHSSIINYYLIFIKCIETTFFTRNEQIKYQIHHFSTQQIKHRSTWFVEKNRRGATRRNNNGKSIV
jgi:hypothetical protein